MTLVRNIALFFVLFLPLSCATGVATGVLVGPIPPTHIGYEFQVFLTGALPLLLPSFLAVPVLHFAYRFGLRGRGSHAARGVAVLATPAALLAVHVAFFRGAFWSPPLLLLFLVPGAIYGWTFGIVRRDAT